MIEGKLPEVFERLSTFRQYPSIASKKDEAAQLQTEDSIQIAEISMHRGAPISEALYSLNKLKI